MENSGPLRQSGIFRQQKILPAPLDKRAGNDIMTVQ